MAPSTFGGEIENGATRRAHAWSLFGPWPLTDSSLLSIIVNFHPTFWWQGLSGSVGRGGGGGGISLGAEKKKNGDFFFFFCLFLLTIRCSRFIIAAVNGGGGVLYGRGTAKG